jgi:hypothetical protein
MCDYYNVPPIRVITTLDRYHGQVSEELQEAGGQIIKQGPDNEQGT